jgi:thiol-disulfide isomerase/thioredoxin
LYIVFNSGSQSKYLDPPQPPQAAANQQPLQAAPPKPQAPPPPSSGPHKVVEIESADQAREFLTKKEAGMLLVYAPWCGHCKMMMPQYEAASNQTTARFARLEGAKAQDFMREKQIRGFPTVFTVNKNGEVAPYQSGRDTNSLVAAANAL